MDPVSTNLDNRAMDSEDGNEAVADLDTRLGELQMGGGGDMLIDEYDVVDEKTEVAIITAEDSPEEQEPEIRADDCILPEILQYSSWELRSNSLVDDAMKLRILPKDADLETDSEAVHTWVIDDWRHLEKKTRGPKFECGGHPWCVGS